MNKRLYALLLTAASATVVIPHDSQQTNDSSQPVEQLSTRQKILNAARKPAELAIITAANEAFYLANLQAYKAKKISAETGAMIFSFASGMAGKRTNEILSSWPSLAKLAVPIGIYQAASKQVDYTNIPGAAIGYQYLAAACFAWKDILADIAGPMPEGLDDTIEQMVRQSTFAPERTQSLLLEHREALNAMEQGEVIPLPALEEDQVSIASNHSIENNSDADSNDSARSDQELLSNSQREQRVDKPVTWWNRLKAGTTTKYTKLKHWWFSKKQGYRQIFSGILASGSAWLGGWAWHTVPHANPYMGAVITNTQGDLVFELQKNAKLNFITRVLIDGMALVAAEVANTKGFAHKQPYLAYAWWRVASLEMMRLINKIGEAAEHGDEAGVEAGMIEMETIANAGTQEAITDESGADISNISVDIEANISAEDMEVVEGLKRHGRWDKFVQMCQNCGIKAGDALRWTRSNWKLLGRNAVEHGIYVTATFLAGYMSETYKKTFEEAFDGDLKKGQQSTAEIRRDIVVEAIAAEGLGDQVKRIPWYNVRQALLIGGVAATELIKLYMLPVDADKTMPEYATGVALVQSMYALTSVSDSLRTLKNVMKQKLSKQPTTQQHTAH